MRIGQSFLTIFLAYNVIINSGAARATQRAERNGLSFTK